MRSKELTADRRPLSVWLFTSFVLLWELGFLLLDTKYVGKYPIWSGVWTLIGLGSLMALVVGRRRWAWWVFLAGPVSTWISPVWGARFQPLLGLLDLVVAGLLLSPSMRHYVFAKSRPRRRLRPRRASFWPLAVSGALTVLTALPVRHPVEHSVAARVVTWTIVWLLLATAIRLVVLAAGRIRRLFGRSAARPPAATPDS